MKNVLNAFGSSFFIRLFFFFFPRNVHKVVRPSSFYLKNFPPPPPDFSLATCYMSSLPRVGALLFSPPFAPRDVSNRLLCLCVFRSRSIHHQKPSVCFNLRIGNSFDTVAVGHTRNIMGCSVKCPGKCKSSLLAHISVFLACSGPHWRRAR